MSTLLATFAGLLSAWISANSTFSEWHLGMSAKGVRRDGEPVIPSFGVWWFVLYSVIGLAATEIDPGRAAADQPQSLTYEGMWFEIEYPASFTARGSLPSADDPTRYDSAFFTSPDGAVSFYVCSPQWGREPTDIALDEDKERLVATEMAITDGRTVTHTTIQAKDGSYTRSYQDTVENDGAVRWVIGLEYSDSEVYQRYRGDYWRFKGSLRQFAD